MPGDLNPSPSIVLTETNPDCDGECAMRFDACYNRTMTESLQCCQEGTACVVKDKWYAQCLTAEDAEMNIDMGWDGRCALRTRCVARFTLACAYATEMNGRTRSAVSSSARRCLRA